MLWFVEKNISTLALFKSSRYNICIRKEDGRSCIIFEECSDDNSFTVSGIDVASKTGTNCGSVDYVEIIGGSATCGGNVFVDRFCGQKLGAAEASVTGTGRVCGTLIFTRPISYFFHVLIKAIRPKYCISIFIFQIVHHHSQ